MNLAGHRDRRLPENYFEPCFLVRGEIRSTWRKNPQSRVANLQTQPTGSVD